MKFCRTCRDLQNEIPTNEDEARLFLDRVKARPKPRPGRIWLLLRLLNKTFGLSEQGDLWEA